MNYYDKRLQRYWPVFPCSHRLIRTLASLAHIYKSQNIYRLSKIIVTLEASDYNYFTDTRSVDKNKTMAIRKCFDALTAFVVRKEKLVEPSGLRTSRFTPIPFAHGMSYILHDQPQIIMRRLLR